MFRSGEKELVSSILLALKRAAEAKIKLPQNRSRNIASFWFRTFREFGAVWITVVNRGIVKACYQLPRQKHLYHYHKTKSETFQFFGDHLEVDGHPHKLLKVRFLPVDPRCGINLILWKRYFGRDINKKASLGTQKMK